MNEPKTLTIVSLGAGVQSSVMVLMAACGELTPMPDCAVFADTQAEPESVYTWLNWLEKQLPFPVYRVKSGKKYMKGSIPAFVLNPNGSKGILGRKCTLDYKIIPIQKKVRELLKESKCSTATMWIGISTDEFQRMKQSRVDYIENQWPLIKRRMSRQDCLKWMKEKGHPEPPRSACVFCPFHSDVEWRRLQTNEPIEFQRAVDFEKQIHIATANQEVLRGVPYLSPRCVPLDQIDFRSKFEKGEGFDFDLNSECEGMCGI